MHSPQARAHLEQCRATLAASDVSDEMRKLADNLITNLLDMHDANRLRLPVFMLAVDSLELVPGLHDCVNALRATASREWQG